MHEGLRFKALSRLPQALRKLAVAACSKDASLFTLKRFLTAAADASDSDGRACLAAFYALLDPAKIPPLEPFEPTVIERAVNGILEIFQSLYNIAVPDELGFELWSRVWPWANFIYTYKDHLPGPPLPEATFCIEFLIYTTRFQTNHEAMPFVCNSAGFKSLLTAAWGFLLDVEDPETRDFGLSQVSTLLPGMKPGIDPNLEEMIDAAGSVDHLALLIINHTQATLDMAKKPMTVTDVYFIRAILDFVVEAEHLGIPGQQMYEDSLGKLGTSLARHNFAQVLVVAARRLGETGDNTKLITGTLERCLLFLARVFIIPSGQRRLPSAISEGLLCALICAGHFDGLIQNHFSLFFGGILPLCLTSYYAVAALQGAFADAEQCAATRVFRCSPGFKRWEEFRDLLKKAFVVLEMSQGGHIPDRACDDTECNSIHDKTDLWRCSGCLDVYYCSPECQKSDWRAGGHREICSESGTLRLSMQNTPSVRERDFLRYYIDAEYHFSKATIYLEQALCLQRFPNSAYFTLFDYTWNGRADISVHALESDSPPVLDLYAYGAEWQDSIARARRSGGRMELHVVRMQQGRSAPRYVLIPLHRDRTDVVVLLKELSSELPTALDDPILLEVWAKFQPRLDAADKDIRETH